MYIYIYTYAVYIGVYYTHYIFNVFNMYKMDE